MSNDKKPQVYPSKLQNEKYLSDQEKLAKYEAEKLAETLSILSSEAPIGHGGAIEEMRARTLDQLRQKKENGRVIEPDLAEPNFKPKQMSNTERQIQIRDETLAEYQKQTNNYQKLVEGVTNNNNNNNNNNFRETKMENKYNTAIPPSKPPINKNNNDDENDDDRNNKYIYELSQPDFNCSFDVIPLPSKGKLYKNKKSSIRVAYMTTADENILTSPNLLQSGKFLEILFNRKILEPELRYKDLHVGDRNAIMLWLRATAYGEMYPITIYDENDEPFDSEVDLNELKTIELGAEPDEDGLFDFQFPLSKINIKFKLLTCGDVDYIEELVSKDTENKSLVNQTNTYTLQKLIVEIDGERNKTYINDFINQIRIYDAKALTDYIKKIESGIDLTIDVTTPGGGSISTFLPLNIKFFWPNVRI